MPTRINELLPILILLAAIGLVVTRLPRVDVGHEKTFLKRRFLNWFPVGLTYAFLYMGRYNLNTLTPTVFTKADYSDIYFWGTLTYGISFVLNGPLADKFGGRKTILAAAVGSAFSNLAMGAFVLRASLTSAPSNHGLVSVFSILYAINMYFQSFGAVSIVKVNSAWFHLRERGTFGGIFGILISLGVYFAFDWSFAIQKHLGFLWVFVVPAIVLFVLAVADFFLVRDTPGEAGHSDFDTGDASSTAHAAIEPGEGVYRKLEVPPGAASNERTPILTVAKMMFTSPIILTISAVEFCSGYLRNAIMQYYRPYIKETSVNPKVLGFVYDHWGMLLCVAGITGGVFAGLISDRVFHSRRGPVSAVLYGIMVVGAGILFGVLGTPMLGWLVVFMSLAIIGVHGMLSGTASMDFGGKKNVGVAVGIIDGCVYLGTAVESLILGRVLPKGEAAKIASNWWTWPTAMLPVALVGFLLTLRLWNARADKKSAAH